MKDKELKLEEIEVTHTLGGSGENRVHQGREKWRGCIMYSGAEQYTIDIWSRRSRHETWCCDAQETKIPECM